MGMPWQCRYNTSRHRQTFRQQVCDSEVGQSENLKGTGTVWSDKRKSPFRKDETDKGTKKGIKTV